MKFRRRSLLLFCVVVFLAVSTRQMIAQIQVDSATPNAAPQGTVTLDVAITGNGFKKGATAQWFITGTTNPGGVTVNSTTFKGSTQLTANITVAADATISGFDIVVKNTDGRTGKGTDKFAVTVKGTPVGCTTSGTPSGFTLAAQLNPVQPNGAALLTTQAIGNAIRVRPLDLNRDGVVDSLAAFVTSGTSSGGFSTTPGTQGTYVFLLDPVTGKMQPNNPVTGVPWTNPLVLLTVVRATGAAAGDVNGDGVPDFLMVQPADHVAYLFVGSVSSSTFNPSYTGYQIQPPAGSPTNWAQAIALGDLDGDGKDEVVVSAAPGKSGPSLAAVFIFKYAAGSLTYSRNIQDPTGGGFGGAIAIGNIDGAAGNELVVQGGTGVYVFPAPLQPSSYFTLTGPGPNFGRGLAIADVNVDGFPDLVVITGDQFKGSDTTAMALVFSGIVHPGDAYTNQLLPAPGNAYSWAAPNFDIGDMLAGGAVLVGTPNANNGATQCSTTEGAAHLFTSPFNSVTTPNYLFEAPTVQKNYMDYGYGLGIAPGYPFIVIGEKGRDVGTTTTAGQVYVYKKN
jgi:hypothetical protein